MNRKWEANKLFQQEPVYPIFYIAIIRIGKSRIWKITLTRTGISCSQYPISEIGYRGQNVNVFIYIENYMILFNLEI